MTETIFFHVIERPKLSSPLAFTLPAVLGSRGGSIVRIAGNCLPGSGLGGTLRLGLGGKGSGES